MKMIKLEYEDLALHLDLVSPVDQPKLDKHDVPYWIASYNGRGFIVRQNFIDAWDTNSIHTVLLRETEELVDDTTDEGQPITKTVTRIQFVKFITTEQLKAAKRAKIEITKLDREILALLGKVDVKAIIEEAETAHAMTASVEG